jgi:hypothetical protein
LFQKSAKGYKEEASHKKAYLLGCGKPLQS